jgi:hypothetical protein
MTNLQSAAVVLILAFFIGAVLGVAFIRDEQIHSEVVQK